MKSGVIFVMMSNGHEEPIYTLRCRAQLLYVTMFFVLLFAEQDQFSHEKVYKALKRKFCTIHSFTLCNARNPTTSLFGNQAKKTVIVNLLTLSFLLFNS